MKKITFALILLLFWACEKPPKPNEPFYCKINYNRFRPNGGTSLYGTILYAELTLKKTFFSMLARDFETKENIFIIIKDINTVKSGTYKLGGTDSKMFLSYSPNYSANVPENFYSFQDKQGELTLKLENGYASGTFYADVKSDKTGKTKRIEKGQFSLGYTEN